MFLKMSADSGASFYPDFTLGWRNRLFKINLPSGLSLNSEIK